MLYFLLGWGAAFLVLFPLSLLGSPTSEEAAVPPGAKPSFGPPITLWQAAKRFFSFPSAWVLLIATVAAWSIKIYVGDWRPLQILILPGTLLCWPVAEWVVHRYFEHARPRTIFGRTYEMESVRTHRLHHGNPWDPKYGLSPPYVLVLFCFGLPLGWLLCVPFPGALLGIALTLTLIFNYEWIHFLIHTSYKPKTWLYRRLWAHHRLHHFKNEHYWFGLTMLGGDALLKTKPAGMDVPRSETVMTLGGEGDTNAWADLPAGEIAPRS